MTGDLSAAKAVRSAIREHRPSIYDAQATELTEYFYTLDQLKALLRAELIGRADLCGLPNKTRGKAAKKLVCEALGYDAPRSFKRKISPNLFHANVSAHAYKSPNFQPVNDQFNPAARYVFLIIRNGVIANVEVILGADLEKFDNTGTRTNKFQAARRASRSGSVLASATDTVDFVARFAPSGSIADWVSPVCPPTPGQVLDIATVYQRLSLLVGQSYSDPGQTQERNRGSVVHRAACKALGLSHFADHGQFPDILSQLLEVKLQLAPTIDLGNKLPNSTMPLDLAGGTIAIRDVRYAIFYGDRHKSTFSITDLVIVTGQDFFDEFLQFEGVNSKLQIRLPPDWFS